MKKIAASTKIIDPPGARPSPPTRTAARRRRTSDQLAGEAPLAERAHARIDGAHRSHRRARRCTSQ